MNEKFDLQDVQNFPLSSAVLPTSWSEAEKERGKTLNTTISCPMADSKFAIIIGKYVKQIFAQDYPHLRISLGDREKVVWSMHKSVPGVRVRC